MVMDAVLGRAVRERSHVRIVSIGQNAYSQVLDEFRQQLGGPEDAALACPGIFGIPVEAVNEDNAVKALRISHSNREEYEIRTHKNDLLD